MKQKRFTDGDRQRSDRKKRLEVYYDQSVSKDVLQCCCFNHTRAWLFLRHQRSWCRTGKGGSLSEGVGVKQRGEEAKLQLGLDCVTPHQLQPLFILSGIQPQPPHFSAIHSLVLLIPQNDDGPDVRAGSGDILLVHATETDRKGIVQSTIRVVYLLCLSSQGQCVTVLSGHWSSF